MAAESIDELLVRYLGLLHEYTDLRGQLASRQSSMFANLARANFAAERGFRYGPDHFDGRMQAVVRLAVADARGDGDMEVVPAFTVERPKKEPRVDDETEKKVVDDKSEQKPVEDEPKQEPEQKTEQKPEQTTTTTTTTTTSTKKAKAQAKPAAKSTAPRDPLQWFGVLTPMALRQAQTDAITAVDTMIPRLASLSAEMAAVEIEVRRARKKLARTQKHKGAAETTHGSDLKTAAVSV